MSGPNFKFASASKTRVLGPTTGLANEKENIPPQSALCQRNSENALTHRVQEERAASTHTLAMGAVEGCNPRLVQGSLLHIQRTLGNRFAQRVVPPTKKSADTNVDTEIEDAIETKRGGGQPLDGTVRRQMENVFQADLSDVRIHHDAAADDLNQAVSARAFATGHDIFFSQGAYNPGSSAGRELLAHELTHVMQHKGGGVRCKLAVSEPGDALEREADDVARQIIQAENQPERATDVSLPGGTYRSPPAASATLGPAFVQRQTDPSSSGLGTAGGTTTQSTPSVSSQPSGSDVASNYEADALTFFETNMTTELRTAAAVEGAAMGRQASYSAGNQVRAVCEPFERDQEIDTNILNTVFSVAGGGASIGEAGTSGATTAPAGSRAANIGSRIVRAGLGVVQVWMPTLAGYRTVGSLKDAAVRMLGEEAASSGETGSSQFLEYENDVMTALRSDWQDEIDRVKVQIEADPNPENVASIARVYWPTQRGVYLNRLRSQYGSRSQYAQSMVGAITHMLQPKLQQLGQHLQEAKDHRERVQGWSAIGAGIAGGAAIGAGIGVWGLGVGAVPGAIVGGIVGGVVGLGAAIGIWSD